MSEFSKNLAVPGVQSPLVMPYSARVSILVEIAEKADVSVEGVVRVLTREPVSDAIKERVLAVLDDLTPEQTRAVQRFALAALHDVLEQQGDVSEWPEPAAVPDENQLALPVASMDEEPDLPAATPDAALVQLSSVLGELAEAVRDLRRETDAERRERVDDLAVLIDLITTGWQGLDTRLGRIERQVSRLESGRREPVVGPPTRVVPTTIEAPPVAAPPVAAKPSPPPAEPSGRDRLPIVAVLTLVGAGIVTLAVLQLASGGPDISRLVAARETTPAATTGLSATTGGPTSTPTETRPAATTTRRPPATTSKVGDDVGSDDADEAAAHRSHHLAEDGFRAAGDDRPRRHDGCAAAGLQTDAQLGLGAGQGRHLLRRGLHPAGRRVLPRYADGAAPDASGLCRVPARRLPLGRAARLRRPRREEPRRAGRRLAVHRLLS